MNKVTYDELSNVIVCEFDRKDGITKDASTLWTGKISFNVSDLSKEIFIRFVLAIGANLLVTCRGFGKGVRSFPSIESFVVAIENKARLNAVANGAEKAGKIAYDNVLDAAKAFGVDDARAMEQAEKARKTAREKYIADAARAAGKKK